MVLSSPNGEEVSTGPVEACKGVHTGGVVEAVKVYACLCTF